MYLHAFTYIYNHLVLNLHVLSEEELEKNENSLFLILSLSVSLSLPRLIQKIWNTGIYKK